MLAIESDRAAILDAFSLQRQTFGVAYGGDVLPLAQGVKFDVA